jgi:cytochrome bd-type quinol oxidase subunit 2
MDKKEINSPKMTAKFLFWVAGVGVVLLVALLHYVWKVF